MKSWILKGFLACRISSLLISSQASAFFEDYGCCEDGPLTCGAFSIQAKGGVVPSHYTKRGKVWLTVPVANPAVFSVSRTARFRKQYQTPWEVGGELTWNASSHIQLFAEYAHQQAKGKTFNFTAGTFLVSEVNSDYKTDAFFLGARYFFNSILCNDCWGSLAPFAGIKGGFVWQKGSNYRLSLFGEPIGTFTYYKKQTAVSAGAQIGLDWSINCNWGIVLTAEAVATQGLQPSHNNVLDPLLTGGLTNVSIGETGKVISFPVTLGVRYTF